MTKLSMTVMLSEEGVSGLGPIHQMTKHGCELWPRAPFCVSRFLSVPEKNDVLSDHVRAWNYVSSYDIW